MSQSQRTITNVLLFTIALLLVVAVGLQFGAFGNDLGLNNNQQQLTTISEKLSSIKSRVGDNAEEQTATDLNDNLKSFNTDFSNEQFAQEPTLSNIDNIFTKARGLFGGIDVNTRQNLFHVEATVPLNNRRNDWNGTVNWTGSTYRLNGTGYIDSSQRGEYQPGSTAEFGMAVFFDSLPDSNDDDRVEWGYINTNDGVYYGVNTTCTFVGVKKAGTVLDEVCQENWNVDTLDGDNDTDNPSGKKLLLKDVNMYQTRFSWYGGGLIEPGVILDDVTGQDYFAMHRFDIQNQTSLDQISLPLSLNVSNDDDEDVSVNIAGRQYSILDEYEKTGRQMKEFRESLTASASEYTPAISLQVEDGFENVVLDLVSFSATPTCDVNAHVRFDTNLTNANFTEPTLVENANESLIVTDTNATSWQDADGNPSGFYLDFSQLASGQNSNKEVASIQTEKVSAVIGEGELITLAFKADSTSCDVNDITMQSEADF